ncbi:MAG: EAL domain-containing protein, partial [Kordiimonas sp.]
EVKPRKRTPGMLEINARPAEPLKPSAQMKMVKIEREDTESETRYLDADIMRSIVNVLSGADVTGMVRKQRVMAILGDEAALPVMVHRFVPSELVFETLLERPILAESRWLLGYVEGFLADRLLASMPSMENEQSIASSIRLTCDSVCSAKFDTFNQEQGKRKRSSLIIEFSALDVMANFSSYLAAHEKLDDLGYKVAIADVDIRMLPLLDYGNLRADFIKLVNPVGKGSTPLKPETKQMVQDHVHKIGLARIILDGCASEDDVNLGQELGITLFQGVGVEPRSAN